MSQIRYIAFGGSIRALREAQGLSQEALAKAAGIGRSTLGHLENGEDVRLSRISAVAKVLGASVEAVAESRDFAERRQIRLEQTIRVHALQTTHLRIALSLCLGEPAAIRALDEARKMVRLWERERVCSPFYIETWKQLLKGGPRSVGRALSRMDSKWEPALLQNSPFGSLLNQPV